MKTEDEIVMIILDEAVAIHRNIGPGMFESVYSSCLCYALQKRGLSIRKEMPVPLIYDGIKFECGFRADIVVENKVIIEVKNIEAIADIHIAQTLTYIRLLNLRLGLILNFKSVLMKDGIRRVVNKL